MPCTSSHRTKPANVTSSRKLPFARSLQQATADRASHRDGHVSYASAQVRSAIEASAVGKLDNRPAHRILYAYASLLARRHPRKAAPWFRAMVYLNPPDNMGARFTVPGGPRG
jgi:hypothetical protein